MNIIPRKRFFPKPRHAPHVAGEMNKTESLYASHLELRKRAGDIIDYKFEALTFKLVSNVPGKRNGSTYNPDFLVITKEGFILVEVKGFWRDDARLKVKVAAELYPWFRWQAVMKKGNSWETEEF